MPRRDPIEQQAQQKPAAAQKTRPNGRSTRGRKTDYDAERMPAQAEVLCRDHGFTEAELATALLCSEATVRNWMTAYPEFLAAIKRGADAYDNVKVRGALRSRALGYEYTETEDGYSEKQGAWEKTAHKKLAPDVTACIFWLVNRQPDEWRHVARTIIQGDGKNPVKHTHEGSVAVEDMSVVQQPARAAEVHKILQEAGAIQLIAADGPSEKTH